MMIVKANLAISWQGHRRWWHVRDIPVIRFWSPVSDPKGWYKTKDADRTVAYSLVTGLPDSDHTKKMSCSNTKVVLRSEGRTSTYKPLHGLSVEIDSRIGSSQ